MNRLLIGIPLVALPVLLAGCEGVRLSFSRPGGPDGPAAAEQAAGTRPAATPAPEPQEPPLDYMAGSAVRDDDGGGKNGAVDTALELSRKYAAVAEQLMETQKTNKALTQENRKLLSQVAQLEDAVAQAQKELGDANDEIMEQKRALQEWKNNVMGFRRDMEQYEEAQIDALRKILMLLNGETAPAAGGPIAKPSLSVKDASSDPTGKNSG